VDDPHEAAVKVQDEVFSTPSDIFDAASGKEAAELVRWQELDESRSVGRNPGLGYGAAADEGEQIATYGLDLGQLGHG
jgi:hypothetical protein